MSTFLVEIKTIDQVHPHSNADRLEVATFSDLAYTLVAPKGQFQPGDKIVYIPLDSQLPEPLIEELGVKTYLSGPNQNVVQTAVLRGVASQGIPAPISILTNRDIPLETPNSELAERLGIVKYDPEPKDAENAILYPLPGNRHSYDIENAERYAEVIHYILENQIEVVVTEKLEGCHIGVYMDENGPVKFIRNNAIIENEGEENPVCRLMRTTGLVETAQHIYLELGLPISVHAEALGAGSGRDYYQLGQSTAKIFDIGIKRPEGWTYLSEYEILLLAGTVKLDRVPKLYEGHLEGFLGGCPIAEIAHGKSQLNPSKLREGIVIKPAVETTIPLALGGGRLIVKQRDPIYLGKAAKRNLGISA